ncbi:RNA polymerase sigma factor [Luteolibacter sp. Populi]|uniref:RNA polymerase sigma factor n=1 Tax=Luteolibacter sp. Populi TaxID=3230487 RepID=UPI00346715DE
MSVFRHSPDSCDADRCDADFRRYVVAGDAEAFRRLVERHLPLVQEAAARVLGSRSGWVDDVVQDVFLMLARKARQLPPDIVLAAWLHRQAVRRAIDVVRSESRRRKREEAVDLAPGESEDGDLWNAIAPRLDREMLRLSEQDREVLALRFMERRSSEEIATRLGVSSVAVRKRVERALGKLRERLAGPLPGTLTATALAAYLSVPTAKAASAGKVAAICSGSLAAAPALPLTTLTLMTKSHLYIASAVLTIGAGAFLAGRSSVQGNSRTDQANEAGTAHSADLPGAEKSAQALARRTTGGSSDFPNTKEGRLAMLRMILSNADALYRGQALDRFIARLDPAEFKDIVGYLKTYRPNSDLESQAVASAGQCLISAWAQQDPVAALEFLSGGGDNASLLQMIASVWAARDANAAIAWAKARPGYKVGEDREDPFMFGLIGSLASHDPAKATALLTEMPFGMNRRSALTGMIPYITAQGEEAMLQWMDGLQDEKLRKGAANLIAREIANSNPQTAAEWIVKRMGSDTEFSSINFVFEQWMRKDSGEALTYFETLPAGKVRADAFNSIVTQLSDGQSSRNDENADWIIERMGEGKLPIYSMSWVVERWMQRDSTAAMGYFETLSGNDASAVSTAIVKQLCTTDPSAAGAFVEAHPDRMSDAAIAKVTRTLAASDPSFVTHMLEKRTISDRNYIAAMISWLTVRPQEAERYFDDNLDSMPEQAKRFYTTSKGKLASDAMMAPAPAGP